MKTGTPPTEFRIHSATLQDMGREEYARLKVQLATYQMNGVAREIAGVPANFKVVAVEFDMGDIVLLAKEEK